MFPMVYDTMRQLLKASYPRRASLLLLSAPFAAVLAEEDILNVHDTIVELDQFIGGIFCFVPHHAMISLAVGAYYHCIFWVHVPTDP